MLKKLKSLDDLFPDKVVTAEVASLRRVGVAPSLLLHEEASLLAKKPKKVL
jgi:hypothetical protein